MRAYNGTIGGHLSNASYLSDYCKAWKKPGAKELRRSERQEAKHLIRKEITEDKTREVLTKQIRKQQAEWDRLFALMDDL